MSDGIYSPRVTTFRKLTHFTWVARHIVVVGRIYITDSLVCLEVSIHTVKVHLWDK